MNCSLELIEAYLDDELDIAQRAAVAEHLTGCPACAEASARLSEQKSAIRAAAPYYDAPPGLQTSIHTALARAVAKERPSAASGSAWRWLALAACLLLALSVAWNVMQFRPRGAQNELAQSIVAEHVRSLMGDHLLDVVSTDRHTVKPWFAGKLDFSPEVKDLAEQGFPLAGGRADYLAGRRVAALVYHRRLHVINLFQWPDNSSPGETSLSRDGYHLRHWTSGPMTYWAVSDVSPADLETFRNLFR